MYKQSKIRNLLYFSKFNKKKTIFYYLQVTLVPVHLVTFIHYPPVLPPTHTLELRHGSPRLCGKGAHSSLSIRSTPIDNIFNISSFKSLSSEDLMINESVGPQAGTKNSLSEIIQKKILLCVGSSVVLLSYQAEVPSRTRNPHRPPVGMLVARQLGFGIIATRKPKEPFAYGICLQNNELLYYLKDSSVVKNVTPPPRRWGRK